MDRQIVYVGSVPTDTDQLLQSRNTLVGLGYLAQAVFGNAHAYVDGLACTPGTGLNVLIGPGSLMTPSVVDADYYGTLPPSSDPVVKLAINTTVTTLAVPAAGATWCVAAVFSEQQGGATVLPYFNATNPGQTMFGVDGQGVRRRPCCSSASHSPWSAVPWHQPVRSHCGRSQYRPARP